MKTKLESSLISIIVNCHNGEKYLNQCISSILKQKYQNYEVIFFDNSSKDNSKKILQSFKEKKIKYYYSKVKLKLYDARNIAISKSKGDLITFLDTDDWWDENYLSSKVEYLSNKKIDYFYSKVYFFNQKKKSKKINKDYDLPSGRIYDFLAKDYFIIISGLIIRKKVLNKIGYFNKNFNIIGDFDLVMRISKIFYGYAFNQPMVYYRVHNHNFLTLNSKMHFEEMKFWFKSQIKKNDCDFKKNIKFLRKKLLSLEINYLFLNKDKSLYLLIKILKYPDFFKKYMYLIAFFMPKILIKILRS